MQLHLDDVASLVRACAATGEAELDCDELLDVLAAHLEGLGPPSSGDRRHELAEAHLRLCANCREESEALAELLREDRSAGPGGIDP